MTDAAWAAFDALTGRGPYERHPIDTAPRDGRAIIIGHPDVGEYVMSWGHIQRNGLFPGVVGMWVAPDGGFTWQDDPEGGPSDWREVEA